MSGSGSNQLQIANLAFAHIGQKPITSIVAGSSVQADRLLEIWAPCVRDVLADKDWGFATIPEYELQDATYSTVNYAYAYTYPTDCVALWRVYNSSTTDKDIGEAFEVVYDTASTKQLILTDAQDAYARYSYNLADPTYFSPKCVLALSHKLASILAMSLNGEEEQSKAQGQAYLAVLSDAKRISGHESNAAKSTHNPFIESRG